MPTQEQITAEVVRVARHELRQSLGKIEKALARVTPDQVWQRTHEKENAIGNLLLHLAGNVRQWIICGLGGAEDRRDRAAEFAQRAPLPLDELFERLRLTVEEADDALAEISPETLLATHKIQVYEVSGLEAILHVITHFAEHTGQILWAVKRLTREDLGFYAHLDGPKSSGRA
jgi:uncharacterized damage-inducible protein DinB